MVLARPGQGPLLELVDILLVDVACPFLSPSPLLLLFRFYLSSAAWRRSPCHYAELVMLDLG